MAKNQAPKVAKVVKAKPVITQDVPTHNVLAFSPPGVPCNPGAVRVPIYVCNSAGTGWGEDVTDPANLDVAEFIKIPTPDAAKIGGCRGGCHAKPCPVVTAIEKGWPVERVIMLVKVLQAK